MAIVLLKLLRCSNNYLFKKITIPHQFRKFVHLTAYAYSNRHMAGRCFLLQAITVKWIRFAIGYVFIVSGAIKLMDPSFKQLFIHLGFPFPSTFLFLLAVVEIVCGALIVANMYIRMTAALLMVVMVGALATVKLPILFTQGIVSFLFEARLDIVMLILLILLWENDG